MMRTVVVALPLLLASGPVGGAEIPQTLLDTDQAQCLAACSESREESQCASYCSCVTDGMRTEFTLEEYNPMATAFAAGQQADADSVARLGSIATACVQDTFQ